MGFHARRLLGGVRKGGLATVGRAQRGHSGHGPAQPPPRWPQAAREGRERRARREWEMRASPQKGSREPHEQRGREVKGATGGDARARGRGVARGGACGVSHLHSATALKLGGGLSAQAPAAMPSKA